MEGIPLSWHRFDRADLFVIAAGGVAGATLRWLIMGRGEAAAPAGWFAYSPNTTFTLTSSGLRTTTSQEVLTLAAGIPLPTLIVNVAGCLLLGALTQLIVHAQGTRRRRLVGAAIGLCGSLTTFSTFAVEVAVLLRASPPLPPELQGLQFERDETSLILYLVVSVLGGGLAFWIGRRGAQRFDSAT